MLKPRMGCGSRDEERQQEPRKMDVVRLKVLKNGAWLEKLQWGRYYSRGRC